MFSGGPDSSTQRTRAIVFIAEITARAFIIADSNKRRTLSRADIAKALSKSDQFDFLIDIVPREEPLAAAPGAARNPGKKASGIQTKVEVRALHLSGSCPRSSSNCIIASPVTRLLTRPCRVDQFHSRAMVKAPPTQMP